jgi:hypothetical protein
MNPLDAVVEALSAADCRPKRLGTNWLAKCPVHDDRKPSLSVGVGEDGRVLLCCFAGCSARQIVEALGLTMSELFADSGRPQRPPRQTPRAAATQAARPPDLPVIDQERAFRLQELGILTVLEGRADCWLARRGFTRDWIAQNPLLGFVEYAPIRGWTHPLVNSWVIRVTGDDGRCVALKAHREDPPPGVPKCCWLPFGTQPPDHPRHGVSTFWPPVSWMPKSELLYLTEGELKAAALLCAGLNATSPTAGAGLHWNPSFLECFRGRRVVVLYDDDPPGHAFRDHTIAALHKSAAQVRAGTFSAEDAA